MIAKIEKVEAVEALDEIVDVSDGVMVARGDLGVEAGVARVPTMQKHVIRTAGAQGKLVITATQMLESMIDRPEPTRAEATDVANAILDGTSALMLSAETTVGRYPVEAVAAMDEIAVEAESGALLSLTLSSMTSGRAEAVIQSAVHLAQQVDADGDRRDHHQRWLGARRGQVPAAAAGDRPLRGRAGAPAARPGVGGRLGTPSPPAALGRGAGRADAEPRRARWPGSARATWSSWPTALPGPGPARRASSRSGRCPEGRAPPCDAGRVGVGRGGAGGWARRL